MPKKRRSVSRKKVIKSTNSGTGVKDKEGYLWCICYIAIFVVFNTGYLIKWHYDTFKTINYMQISLALFLVINIMICVWEISLLMYIKHIKQRSDLLLKTIPKGELGSLFLFQPMTLKNALSLKAWSEIWVVYSLCDTSYASHDSFGWSIDTGNGISALIPSILFAIGMTLQDNLCSPKLLGMLGIAHFWQMTYGTLLYFFQYCYHKRWMKHGNTNVHIFTLVILSNVTWIVFPCLGLWISTQLILADDSDVAWNLLQ